LKQRQYGKLVVPINRKRGCVPVSPEVWASFLTGEMVYGLKFETTSGFGDSLAYKIIKPFRKILPTFLRNRLKFGIGGMVSGAKTFPKLNKTTFLDETNSKAINVPYYNLDEISFDIEHKFAKGRISLKENVQILKILFSKKCKEILKENPRDVDIVFAYLNFPDALCHRLYVRPNLIKHHYVELDIFVEELKSIIEEEVFIIVSDHGFDLKTETHSTYGFFSSSVVLNPKPKKITDFYGIIMKDAHAHTF